MSVLPPEFGNIPHSARSQNLFPCNVRTRHGLHNKISSPVKLRSYFSIPLIPSHTDRQLSENQKYAYYSSSQLLKYILIIQHKLRFVKGYSDYFCFPDFALYCNGDIQLYFLKYLEKCSDELYPHNSAISFTGLSVVKSKVWAYCIRLKNTSFI